MEQTLLLNASFEPLTIVPWQRAMTLWVSGKVEILAEHERQAHAVKFMFKLPSVVRLLRYARIKRQEHVPFTRANLYARDHYCCQYCGKQFHAVDLTFDHVIPASHGGTKMWENIVTACVKCNREKDARTPEEAGMHLKRQPRRPSRLTVLTTKAPTQWRDYLYQNTEG